MTESGTLHLGHTFGSTKRSGRWTVPEQVVLRQRMGSTQLDLTEAELVGPVTTLELDMIGGSVELRVPAGVIVESELATTFASFQDHRDTPPADPTHTLRLRGRAVWGSVEVRGPRRLRRR